MRAEYDTCPEPWQSSKQLLFWQRWLWATRDMDTKLGSFLRTCQFNCHFKIWIQRKTSKCLKTLKTLDKYLSAITTNNTSLFLLQMLYSSITLLLQLRDQKQLAFKHKHYWLFLILLVTHSLKHNTTLISEKAKVQMCMQLTRSHWNS